MASLTPKNREADAVSLATYQAFFNGFVCLVPCVAMVGYGIRHVPTFAARTNWQSRTAMAVTPAFFVTALTGEQSMATSMRAMAQQEQHNHETVAWAQQEWEKKQRDNNNNNNKAMMNKKKHDDSDDADEHFAALYRQSVLQQQSSSSPSSSSYTIVPTLHWYHHLSNYTMDHPVRILAATAIPTVLYIFYGRSSTANTHLTLPSKIMHTRVYGQSATILFLLTIMGVTEYMDRHHAGRYMSAEDADARIQEMQSIRRMRQRNDNSNDNNNSTSDKSKVVAPAQTTTTAEVVVEYNDDNTDNDKDAAKVVPNKTSKTTTTTATTSKSSSNQHRAVVAAVQDAASSTLVSKE